MDIYVNPMDDEEIYGLGVRLIRSEDGGKTYSFINGEVKHLTPSPAQTLHLDHCEMWINPKDTNELILANDGGIYHSYDRGDSWLHLNNIPTGEFYDIEVDHQDPYHSTHRLNEPTHKHLQNLMRDVAQCLSQMQRELARLRHLLKRMPCSQLRELA